MEGWQKRGNDMMTKRDRQRFKELGKRWRGRREKLNVGIEKRKCRKDEREHWEEMKNGL